MIFKSLFTTFVVLTAGIGAASADGTAQNHHCKLSDGTFDGTKTNKQCTTAKGTWEKDATYTGALKTGINAPGGETTGITLTVDSQTYELDLHGDKALTKTVTGLDGKQATVTGYLTTKHGVEVKERRIVVVSTLKVAVAAKPAPAPAPKK